MYCGTITGNGQVFTWNQTTPDRRGNGDKIKKILKTCFEVKEDIFSIEDTVCNDFRYFRFCFGSLLAMPLWFFRFFMIPGK